MKKIFLLAVCTFSLSPGSIVAQASYERLYQGPGNDVPRSIQLLSNNGLVIGGSTGSAGSGGQDALIMRLDAAGNEIWTKAVGTPQDDTCSAVVITSDSCIIACGNTYGGGLGNSDLYLNKLDMNGQLIWSKVYGSANYDFSVEAFPTNDSGFILIGYINYPPVFTPVMGASCNSFMTKFDGNGNVVWSQYYASLSCHYMVYDAVQYPNGDFLLMMGGYCQSSPPGYFSEYYVVRTDSVGQILWKKKNFGFAYDFAVVPTADNGTQFVYTTGAGQVQTLKIDSLGTPVNSFNYGYFSDMAVSSAFEMPDGGFLMIGRVQPDQMNPSGYLFFRTGANGYPLWTKFQRMNCTLPFYWYSETLKRSDNLYSTVSTISSPGFAVILTDSSGQIICGNDSNMVVYTNTLALPVFTNEPHVNTPPSLLTGTSVTNVVDFDFTVLSLCGAVNPSAAPEWNAPELELQVTPNPASSETVIRWEGAMNYEVQITNTLGEVVAVQSGFGEFTSLDVSQLSAGVYMICVMQDSVLRATERLVVR